MRNIMGLKDTLSLIAMASLVVLLLRMRLLMSVMLFKIWLRGLLIGDKGYIRPILVKELKEYAIDLQTPLRINMKD